MTEKPEGAGRRPLDTFDPTADGFTPHTLEQTVQAACDAVEALARFNEALMGCVTPLQLGSLAAQGRLARRKAEAWVEVLAEARDIIELDLPISDTIDNSDIEGWDPADDKPWTGPGKPETLTPAWIVELRGAAADLPIDRLTSYRREIEKHGPVPELIRRHRNRELRNTWWVSMTAEERATLRSEGRAAVPELIRDHQEATEDQPRAAELEAAAAKSQALKEATNQRRAEIRRARRAETALAEPAGPDDAGPAPRLAFGADVELVCDGYGLTTDERGNVVFVPVAED